MKIAIFSPLPPEKTDIANYTMRIVNQLKAFHTIELYTHQSHIEINDCDMLINRYNNVDDIDWEKLNGFDHVLYNIGNNALYHENIWRISQRKSGLIILHDQCLHEFFFQVLYKNNGDSEEYLNWMEYFYGSKGEEEAKRFLSGERTIEEMSDLYPFTELALINAFGIITHTNDLQEFVESIDSIPSMKLNLPYDVTVQKTTKINKPVTIRLLIFGFINPNRRLDQILEVLSEIELSDWYLDIVGQLWDFSHIYNKLKELGIQEKVHFHGFLDEDSLDQHIASSDLIFNLRYPTMGEASGSQLRIWNQGIASLVTNVGWYSELPEDTVIKVNLENEKEDVKKHITSLFHNPENYYNIGENGRSYLIENHSVSNYVKKLNVFLSELEIWKKQRIYYHFLNHLGREISDIYVKNKELNLESVISELIDNT